jgi:hypothetical protein
MSTTSDLMGLGMPAALASRLGYTPTALTATGTSAGTAATMKSKNVLVSSATSQTGAIIPSDLSIGGVMFIACATGSTASAVIYPPTGATITNASSVTLAADKNMIVWRYSSTLLFHVILA